VQQLSLPVPAGQVLSPGPPEVQLLLGVEPSLPPLDELLPPLDPEPLLDPTPLLDPLLVGPPLEPDALPARHPQAK
jgi:hypothetical protein